MWYSAYETPQVRPSIPYSPRTHWTTGNGRVILYTELSDDHLVNIISWIKSTARTEKDRMIAEGHYLLACLGGEEVAKDLDKAIRWLQQVDLVKFMEKRWIIYPHLLQECKDRGITGRVVRV